MVKFFTFHSPLLTYLVNAMTRMLSLDLDSYFASDTPLACTWGNCVINTPEPIPEILERNGLVYPESLRGQCGQGLGGLTGIPLIDPGTVQREQDDGCCKSAANPILMVFTGVPLFNVSDPMLIRTATS
jgi:hypothetical protein